MYLGGLGDAVVRALHQHLDIGRRWVWESQDLGVRLRSWRGIRLLLCHVVGQCTNAVIVSQHCGSVSASHAVACFCCLSTQAVWSKLWQPWMWRDFKPETLARLGRLDNDNLSLARTA
jgi:hypothetical protein